MAPSKDSIQVLFKTVKAFRWEKDINSGFLPKGTKVANDSAQTISLTFEIKAWYALNL